MSDDFFFFFFGVVLKFLGKKFSYLFPYFFVDVALRGGIGHWFGQIGGRGVSHYGFIYHF